MYTRREFGQIFGASLPLALLLRRIDSVYEGVRLGAITYSFNDMPNVEGQDHVDNVIQDCQGCGVGLIELMSNHVEPVTAYQMQQAAARAARIAAMAAANANSGAAAPANGAAASASGGSGAGGGAARGANGRGGAGGGAGRGMTLDALKARDELREWRLLTPMDHFQDIKKKFDDAGIAVYAYCANGLGDDFTPQEIDKMFEQAQALGATVISTSTTVDVAEKLVPFVEKHQYPIAFHGHANITDPNQFALPASFAKAIAMSKYFRINLDIGHFTGANQDAVSFVEENHQYISHMHVKDGTRNNGPIMPDGQGDTPIKPVMQLLKKNQWPIPAIAEFEYKIPAGSNSVQEVAKMIQYMKDAMA